MKQKLIIGIIIGIIIGLILGFLILKFLPNIDKTNATGGPICGNGACEGELEIETCPEDC